MKRGKSLLIGLIIVYLVLLSISVLGGDTTYDFTDTSNFLGYDSDSSFDDPPPPTNQLVLQAQTVLSSNFYDELNVSDNDRYQLSVGDDSERYLLFNTSIGSETVFALNWSWEGYYLGDDGNVTFYVWDWSASSWYDCGDIAQQSSGSSSSEATNSCYIQSNVDNYYNETTKNSYFLVYGTDPDDGGTGSGTMFTDYVSLVTSALEINLSSPENNTISNSLSQTFSCNATGSSLSNITLFVYNSSTSLVVENTSSVSGDSNSSSFSQTLSGSDTYLWNCKITQEDNIQAFSGSNRTLVIDQDLPVVSVVAPVNTTNTTDTGIDVEFIASDTYLDSCWWTQNLGVTNTSVSCSQNITSQTWSEGLSTVSVYANDSAGNIGVGSVTFRIDTQGPLMFIDHPGGVQPEYSSNVSVPLNFTSIDDGIGIVDSCWYSLDSGANISISSCANTTFDTSEGSHTIRVYANDTLGNEGSDQNSFTISLNAPVLTSFSPLNNTYWNNGTNFYLNYTVEDPNGVDTCQLYHDFGGTFSLNITDSSITSGVQNSEVFNLTDNDYSWNVLCNDTLGNGRFSATNKTFTIDTINPVFATINITTTGGSQTINFTNTITEINPSFCQYTIYDSGGIVEVVNLDPLQNESVSCENAGSQATVGDTGTFTLELYAQDLAGNYVYENTSFTVTEGNGTTVVSGGGGGGPGTVIIEGGIVQAENFSVANVNRGDRLDIILARGSVRPRLKEFVILNEGIETIQIELSCSTSNLNPNVSKGARTDIDICDYVVFESDVIDVVPNKDSPSVGVLRVSSPENANFGDLYAFEIIGTSLVDNSTKAVTKLSVTARTPYYGAFLKYAYFPLQQDESPERSSYPVILPALLGGLLFGGLVIFGLRKKVPVLSFIGGSLLFFVITIVLVFVL